MRYAYLTAFLVGILIFFWAGFRGSKFVLPPWEVFPDMDRQLKVMYQKPSDFFANGMASRVPVDGTVPMGFSVPDQLAGLGPAIAGGFTQGQDYFNSGAMGDYFGDGMPEEVEVTPAFIKRGKERFELNCAVCHGVSGDGKGAVSNYWPTPIANLHELRLTDRAVTPDGSIYWTITHGKGLMGPYGGNITVEDRWAIVAYVRALQKAQPAGAVPEGAVDAVAATAAQVEAAAESEERAEVAAEADALQAEGVN
ncbi:MAG: cytochrome c [Verrucomicrobiota bacterium]